MNENFQIDTLPMFDIYRSNRKSKGKKVIRSYRDWIANVKKTLRFVYGVDFISVGVKLGSSRETSVAFLTKSAGDTLLKFIDDPLPFYKRVRNAKERFEGALKTGHYVCSKCNKTLPLSCFRPGEEKTYQTISYLCIPCSNNRKADNRTRRSSTLESSLSQCFKVSKDRARLKGIEFSIGSEYLLSIWKRQGGLCYYSGLPMEYKRIHHGNVRVRPNPSIVSVDRIDPSIGYVDGNVVLCLWIINLMKMDLSPTEFYKIISAIYLHASSL